MPKKKGGWLGKWSDTVLDREAACTEVGVLENICGRVSHITAANTKTWHVLHGGIEIFDPWGTGGIGST